MKNIILSLSIAMLGFSVQASYLYWSVNSSYTMKNTGTELLWSDGTSGKSNFYGARLIEVNGSTETVVDSAQYTTDDSGAQVSWSYEINSSYSYYIELVAYDGSSLNQVGRTDNKSYSDLSSMGVLYDSGSLTPIAQATWHGGGEMNAPEPTSAMLMLLGVAGLALKRKQRKAA